MSLFWQAVQRFLRGAGVAALAAVLTYAIGHVTDLPFDQAWFAVISALLLGLEKFLREKGILPEVL